MFGTNIVWKSFMEQSTIRHAVAKLRKSLVSALDEFVIQVEMAESDITRRKRSVEARSGETYERATHCADLRRSGLTLTKIGELVGKDHSTVSCYLKFLKLHPYIVRDWGRDHPQAKFDTLWKLTKLPRHQQLSRWRELRKY
jgi:hypothetical protein